MKRAVLAIDGCFVETGQGRGPLSAGNSNSPEPATGKSGALSIHYGAGVPSLNDPANGPRRLTSMPTPASLALNWARLSGRVMP
jgi:hypothetical protein